MVQNSKIYFRGGKMKKRNYTSEDVKKLQGSLKIEYTLARRGATKLRELLATEPFVPTLGAYNGQQAVQHAKAGLKAIYLSGWQVAAAANTSGRVYPDQSLYPVNSVPEVVREINNALRRADQIQTLEAYDDGNPDRKDFYLPIIADCEAGFGGALNAYELTLSCIEAGAAAVHFEDQLSSEKKCGHLGGKVLIPIRQAVRNLNAARLAADVAEVDTVILARTDAESGTLITTDIDPLDRPFIDYTKERTEEGFYHFKNGLGACIARGLAYAEYADLLWFETSTPDLAQAQAFADAIHEKFPDQMLAYNCSPSFNWRKYLTEEQCETFQAEIGAMGYKYQFITLAGFHCNNLATFEMAEAYQKTGMRGYSEMQQREFAAQERGFTTVKHQREAGVPYFDAIATAVGATSTTALEHSTETDQF
jgi:isocitrate lyase